MGELEYDDGEELKQQQVRFCEHYALTGRVGESARKAGYSDKTASTQGSRLLRRPEIRAYIKKLNAEAKRRAGITAPRVADSLAEIIFFNPKEIYDENDNPLPLSMLPDHVARNIKSVKIAKNTRTGFKHYEYTFVNKEHLLERIALSLGLLNPDKESGQTLTAINLGFVTPSAMDN